MTDERERDLLREWRRAMDALVSSATSVAGRAEVPRQLREPMQRQIELAQEILARERRIQAQLTHQVGHVFDFVVRGDDHGEVALRLAG